jgi:DNA-binding transcriptional LysR family regulator
MTRGEAVAGLADGSVHAAFLRDHESAQAIRLYEELPVVVAPKDHAVTAFDQLTAGDLAEEVVLAYSEDDAASVAELVGANVGVAIMPQSVARAVSRKDVVVRPYAGVSTEVSLVWVEKSDAVEELIGIVRGRTANSSRAAEAPVKKLSASQKGAAKKARAAAAKAPAKKKKR